MQYAKSFLFLMGANEEVGFTLISCLTHSHLSLAVKETSLGGGGDCFQCVWLFLNH